MKKCLIAVAVSLVVAVGSVQAQGGCATPQCQQAIAWHKGYTAVILKSTVTSEQQYAIEQSIRDAGGRIALIGRHVFLGWIEPRAVAQLRRLDGVALITTAPVDVAAVGIVGSDHHASNARNLLTFYNNVVTGREAARTAKALLQDVPPLLNDVSPGGSAMARAIPATSTLSAPGMNPRGGRLKVSPELAHNPWPNASMTGRISVQVWPTESNGAIDANEFNWNTGPPNYDDVHWVDMWNQAFTVHSFWASQAGTYGRSVSFVVDGWHWSEAPFSISYEPIRRTWQDDYLYINEVLSRWNEHYQPGGVVGGWGASPVNRDNVHFRVQQFIENLVAQGEFGPLTGAYIVFVTPNWAATAPKQFANIRSYAEFGLYTNTAFDNAGYGTANWYRVVRHETGHIFWACDEYSGGCNFCASCYGPGSGYPAGFGPRPTVPNGNCDVGSGASCLFPRQDCMMKTANDVLCPHTASQIGW